LKRREFGGFFRVYVGAKRRGKMRRIRGDNPNQLTSVWRNARHKARGLPTRKELGENALYRSDLSILGLQLIRQIPSRSPPSAQGCCVP
jgi:hypothetical protein